MMAAGFRRRENRPMRICLNMIVKDEAAVIARCLASIKPWVDCWVIVDTGSSDGTQDIVREIMRDLPGELHEREWRNFGHNRGEALELARDKADYLLFIDADETLGAAPGAAWPALREPAYSLEARYGELRYDRVSVIDTRLPWRWNGVLHEYLDAGMPVAQPRLPGFWIEVRAEGARSKDPAKFEKDAAILEAALADEPANARYVFYLAQSHRDAGKLQLAREWYDKRAAMGGWDEEAWYARYQVARLTELLGDESAQVTSAYLRAYEARPARAEPLVALARYFRGRLEWNSAYLFASIACTVPMPQDRLFVDATAYGWWGQDELALAAFYTGRRLDAARIWNALLEAAQLPASERPRIEQNLAFASAPQPT
jgi:glycosyltransferase involved in cell wall biosynthesis